MTRLLLVALSVRLARARERRAGDGGRASRTPVA